MYILASYFHQAFTSVLFFDVPDFCRQSLKKSGWKHSDNHIQPCQNSLGRCLNCCYGNALTITSNRIFPRGDPFKLVHFDRLSFLAQPISDCSDPCTFEPARRVRRVVCRVCLTNDIVPNKVILSGVSPSKLSISLSSAVKQTRP